jgi:hypothetical protein
MGNFNIRIRTTIILYSAVLMPVGLGGLFHGKMTKNTIK